MYHIVCGVRVWHARAVRVRACVCALARLYVHGYAIVYAQVCAYVPCCGRCASMVCVCEHVRARARASAYMQVC